MNRLISRVGKRCYFLRSELGSALSEAAISMPIFLLVIFTGIELLRVSVLAAQLNFAVERGGRALVAQPNTSSADEKVDAAVSTIKRFAPTSLRFEQISICPTKLVSCPVYNSSPGSPGDLVRISADLPVKLVFGGWQVDLHANTVVKNEP